LPHAAHEQRRGAGVSGISDVSAAASAAGVGVPALMGRGPAPTPPGVRGLPAGPAAAAGCRCCEATPAEVAGAAARGPGAAVHAEHRRLPAVFLRWPLANAVGALSRPQPAHRILMTTVCCQ